MRHYAHAGCHNVIFLITFLRTIRSEDATALQLLRVVTFKIQSNCKIFFHRKTKMLLLYLIVTKYTQKHLRRSGYENAVQLGVFVTRYLVKILLNYWNTNNCILWWYCCAAIFESKYLTINYDSDKQPVNSSLTEVDRNCLHDTFQSTNMIRRYKWHARWNRSLWK